MLGLEKLNLNTKVEILHFPPKMKDNTFFEDHWQELLELVRYLEKVQDKVQLPIVTTTKVIDKKVVFSEWDPTHTVVALINNKVVGYMVVDYNPQRPDTITIVYISVLPEYHKRGIGTKLIDKVYDVIDTLDVKINYVLLDVAIKNKQAMNLYNKLGFKPLSSWMYLKVK